ncbi:MAG TPA: beta-L-arabinofuranosidase domain-containing protein [Nocardioidaceae bacterium]|nr:beta-L-arabinofuranosidase domain-containing protein [Nocardioidaceae bacterium]
MTSLTSSGGTAEQQSTRPGGGSPASPTTSAAVRWRPLPLGAASITGGFWAPRQDANADAAVPAGRERLESAGNLQNLRVAAGAAEGTAVGPVFADSDVYKWLEAAAWEYGRRPADDLLRMQREVTALVAQAQADDGYLDSVVQVRYGRDGRYQDLPWSHEHYCAGHLMQAAVAQARCTGDRALLDVAVRVADHLVATFGEDLRHDVDGHPVVEMGLVELYRETGERGYLDLARYFVDARGHGLIESYGQEPTYFSDRVPVREATTVEGHAVRAVYLAAGAADVAAELGDKELLAALETQFDHMMATKTYLTGGLGARWEGESFGDEYELPADRAYAETCAAIGGVQWAWRMLLATGDPKYADAAERMLFNGFLAGVSLAGDEYFYVNPLQLRGGAHPHGNRSPAHGRRGWFDCACCPPNIMRTFASLSGYLASSDSQGVQVHQFATGALAARVGAGEVRVAVETDYPWDGMVRVQVEETGPEAWTLSLRVPGWASGATMVVQGEEVAATPGEYAQVTRTWAAGDVVELRLPMQVRVTDAHPRIDAVRGCVALERGPLVYTVEQADQPDGVAVDDLRLVAGADVSASHDPDLLAGVTVLTTTGRVGSGDVQPAWPYSSATSVDTARADGEEVPVVALPYYAWANRGVGAMRVWLPRA